jgi:hypothetical protein
LREDVGALSAARRWALRELSWRVPTLEQIFTSITHGTTSAQAVSAAAATSVPVRAAGGAQEAATGGLTVLPPAESATRKVVYNLNPFDMGASRDLGRPKAVEGPTPSAAEQRARETQDR